MQVNEQRSGNIFLRVNHPYMTERHKDYITLSRTKEHPALRHQLKFHLLIWLLSLSRTIKQHTFPRDPIEPSSKFKCVSRKNLKGGPGNQFVSNSQPLWFDAYHKKSPTELRYLRYLSTRQKTTCRCPQNKIFIGGFLQDVHFSLMYLISQNRDV